MSLVSTEVAYSGIVFGCTFALVYVLMERKRIKSKQKNYPPCLPYLPIIGSLPFLSKFDELHKFFMLKSKKLGNVFSLRYANK